MLFYLLPNELLSVNNLIFSLTYLLHSSLVLLSFQCDLCRKTAKGFMFSPNLFYSPKEVPCRSSHHIFLFTAVFLYKSRGPRCYILRKNGIFVFLWFCRPESCLVIIFSDKLTKKSMLKRTDLEQRILAGSERGDNPPR